MRAIRELEKIGFRFYLSGGGIKYTFQGSTKPDPDTVKPLLAEIKAKKEEAIHYLQGEPVDPRKEGQKARELLKAQGWCAVKSKALGGEVVLWVKDGKVAVPARWQENVRYTMEELRALAQAPKINEEGLRKIHQAKKLFNGTVQAAENQQKQE